MITCECERSNEPSLVQALHLSNGDTILKKLEAKDGKIDSLLSGPPAQLSNHRRVVPVRACRVTRTIAELATLLATMNEAPANERRTVLEDVYWAVLSSREFLFQSLTNICFQ